MPDGKTLNSGQVGCALSHFLLWNKMIGKGGIVIEDDVAILPHFWQKYDDLMEALPQNWDLVLLAWPELKGRRMSKKYMRPNPLGLNWGTYCYLVSPHFAEVMVEHFTLNVPLDQYLRDTFYYNDSYKVFISRKLFVWHTEMFGSDTHITSY